MGAPVMTLVYFTYHKYLDEIKTSSPRLNRLNANALKLKAPALKLSARVLSKPSVT